jgi:hypothetical protein
MARYAVALNAKIQEALNDRGKPAHSRLSRECDRQSRLGFGDDVVDACCAFVEFIRTGRSEAPQKVFADVDRFGYRALSCLTSMASHLAEVLIEQSPEFHDYDEVMDAITSPDAEPRLR